MLKKFYSVDVETSLDMEAALQVSESMHQVESELQQTLNEDVKIIKERTLIIQGLLSEIQNLDEELVNIEFKDFIGQWFSYLTERSESIKERNLKINKITSQAQLIFEKAQKMMHNDFKSSTLNVADDDNARALIVKLIENLTVYVPAIKHSLLNYPIAESTISEGESNMLINKLTEIQHLEKAVADSSAKCKYLSDLSSKLSAANETRRLLENESPFEHDESYDFTNFSIFAEPSYSFDASKNCVSFVQIKEPTNLALLNDKFIDVRDMSHTLKRNDLNVTGVFKFPQNQTIIPPARRQRRNAMEMIDRAISSKSSFMDQSLMERSVATFNMPHSTPFSSTMLSPELHHNIFGLNLSKVSEISSSSQKHSNQPRKSKDKSMKNESMLSVVMDDITKNIPTITLTDATKTKSPGGTFCDKENFGMEIDFSNNSNTLTAHKTADEDLFDISDSCLTAEY